MCQTQDLLCTVNQHQYPSLPALPLLPPLTPSKFQTQQVRFQFFMGYFLGIYQQLILLLCSAGTISPEPGVLLLSQFIHRMVSTLNQVEKEREVILSRVDQLHHEVTSLGRGLTEQMDALNAKVEDLINQRFPDS